MKHVFDVIEQFVWPEWVKWLQFFLKHKSFFVYSEIVIAKTSILFQNTY